MAYIKNLICMLEKDMKVIHPHTNFTHLCATCKEPVGIFPSGQALISSHRPGEVRIICNRCFNPQSYQKFIYANPELDKLD